MLHLIEKKSWEESLSTEIQQEALIKLENGHILFLPQLTFALTPIESFFLDPKYTDDRSKNISYDFLQNRLWGVKNLNDEEHIQLKTLLQRFATHALKLAKQLFPSYLAQLKFGRTSFRPIEIKERKTSYRKDDKRLHVDAFPSAPNCGQRLLRFFCNVNPHCQNRVWRLGEPFEKVAEHFIPQIRPPFPGWRRLLRLLKITKSYRSLYDHYMLHMHDRMKADDSYQIQADQQIIAFPPGSTWIVQTDQVSHAAMSGQHVFEQTFYLPVEAMQDTSRAPLKVLEKLLRKKLV